MQVQINSDNTISMHNKLSDSIGAYILNVLNRFDPYLTRVEVHLTGEANKTTGPRKSGAQTKPRDKRCLLEARPKYHRSLIVSAESTDIDAAFAGASTKLHRLLESTYGRLDDKRRRKHQMTSKTERRNAMATG